MQGSSDVNIKEHPYNPVTPITSSNIEAFSCELCIFDVILQPRLSDSDKLHWDIRATVSKQCLKLFVFILTCASGAGVRGSNVQEKESCMLELHDVGTYC